MRADSKFACDVLSARIQQIAQWGQTKGIAVPGS